VLLRGGEQRSAIALVLDVFGDEARHFVFVGGCVMGLYARPQGSPIRTTKDVDCVSTLVPWVLQQKTLAKLCEQGILRPDPEIQCRYRIKGTDVDVDVLSPEGLNVGGPNPWLQLGSQKAKPYVLEDGRSINALTPPYFLATKLVAFEDRGTDPQSSKDLEDIVAVAVEVPDLVEQVTAEVIAREIAALWEGAFQKHSLRLSDVPELVDWHLHRDDKDDRGRVITTLRKLASGAV